MAEYITKAQLIRRAQTSKSTVQRMMVAGLPYHRLKKGVVFNWQEAVEWMTEHGYMINREG